MPTRLRFLASVLIAFAACAPTAEPSSPDSAVAADGSAGPDADDTEGGNALADAMLPGDAPPANGAMSFFVTSAGTGIAGGNLGGLAGADARCQSLATDVGAGGKTWRAYLSTWTEDARDRIGAGPWYNVDGELVAANVDGLHAAQLPGALALTERGDAVPGGEHDILTGSDADGRGDPLGATCQNWTSNGENDWGAVGHVDWDPGDSWNAAHLSQCTPKGLQATAGAGRLYCFALP